MASTSPHSQTDATLTIGSLAKLCGVTVRTLRYYEEMDLIGPVKRTEGKYRLYNQHSLKRVEAILALQGLNFSLDEVLATLGPYSASRTFNRSEQIAQTRASLEHQQRLITEKVDQLNKLNREIESRMAVLNDVCTPCGDEAPQGDCQHSCTYKEVHH